jgi:hypothetical protein
MLYPWLAIRLLITLFQLNETEMGDGHEPGKKWYYSSIPAGRVTEHLEPSVVRPKFQFYRNLLSCVDIVDDVSFYWIHLTVWRWDQRKEGLTPVAGSASDCPVTSKYFFPLGYHSRILQGPSIEGITCHDFGSVACSVLERVRDAIALYQRRDSPWQSAHVT